MSKILLQLRGSTGVGKSTAAKQFLEHGNFVVNEINVNGQICQYNVDYDKMVIVTGIYKEGVNCGGLDGKITNKFQMLDYLVRIMRLCPESIVTEAVMYGITEQFAVNLCTACSIYGYEYKGVLLTPSFEDNLEMITRRNGGKKINIQYLYDKGIQARRSTEKLEKRGFNISYVDTSKVDYNDMWKIIADRL